VPPGPRPDRPRAAAAGGRVGTALRPDPGGPRGAEVVGVSGAGRMRRDRPQGIRCGMSDEPLDAVTLEVALLAREKAGPFLLLGLDKLANEAAVESHWADRLKWARRR